MFLTYTPLIKRVVRSFARRANDPFDDLFQVGSIGLIKAMGLFNFKVHANFKSYATYFVTGEIKHYLRDKSSMIKAPRQMKELSYRLNKIIEELTKELGEPPTNEEIAIRLNIKDDKVKEVIDLERRITPISIDSLVNFDDEDETSREITSANAVNEHKEMLKNFENKMILKEAIEGLDVELQKIINMAFLEGYTQSQIAQKLNMAPMNVSRKMKKALSKLLKIITDKGIEKYDE